MKRVINTTVDLESISENLYDEIVHIVTDVIDPNIDTYKNLATALSIILSKIKNEIHY